MACSYFVINIFSKIDKGVMTFPVYQENNLFNLIHVKLYYKR